MQEVSFDPQLIDQMFKEMGLWYISEKRKKLLHSIYKIIEDLSEKQKECMNMYYFERMTLKEIAQEKGVSIRTIRTHLERGIAIIKRRIK